MSKLYYDKLVNLKKLERKIAKVATSPEEKQELWLLVDELVHHRVLGCVLEKLDKKHHEEFLVKLYHAPHDEGLLDYLKKKIKIDVEEFIKAEIESLHQEILVEIKKGLRH